MTPASLAIASLVTAAYLCHHFSFVVLRNARYVATGGAATGDAPWREELWFRLLPLLLLGMPLAITDYGATWLHRGSGGVTSDMHYVYIVIYLVSAPLIVDLLKSTYLAWHTSERKQFWILHESEYWDKVRAPHTPDADFPNIRLNAASVHESLRDGPWLDVMLFPMIMGFAPWKYKLGVAACAFAALAIPPLAAVFCSDQTVRSIGICLITVLPGVFAFMSILLYRESVSAFSAAHRVVSRSARKSIRSAGAAYGIAYLSVALAASLWTHLRAVSGWETPLRGTSIFVIGLGLAFVATSLLHRRHNVIVQRTHVRAGAHAQVAASQILERLGVKNAESLVVSVLSHSWTVNTVDADVAMRLVEILSHPVERARRRADILGQIIRLARDEHVSVNKCIHQFLAMPDLFERLPLDLLRQVIRESNT